MPVGLRATRAGVDEELIFDVGMHRGQDTRFYLSMGYRVVAVEAEPNLVATSRRIFEREIADGRVSIVHCAIAERSGSVPFWIFPDKDEWNTADRAHAEQAITAGYRHEFVEVPARRFADLLEEFGVPLYLKIDIEGADLLCVEDLERGAFRPHFVSLELSRANRDSAFEILAKLYALGYRRFKVMDQALNPSRDARLPTGQRFRFEMGSSGAFGDATPGRWRNAFDIAREIERVLRRERVLAPGGDLRPGAWAVNGISRLWTQRKSPRQWRAALTTASWFDLHAALPADPKAV